MSCGLFVFLGLVIAIYIEYLIKTRTVLNLCESSKCPYCYGFDLCINVEYKEVQLEYTSFSDIFYNLLSVKNVFFGRFRKARVVLKKLAHQSELDRLPIFRSVLNKNAVIDAMSKTPNFRSCNLESSKSLFLSLNDTFALEEIWTILQVNVEPLILTAFSDMEYVPVLYGSCGLMVVVEYCGRPLDHFRTFSWHDRAFLARQLIEAAIAFTNDHPDLRVYLTDVGPDNIVVDDNLRLRFIDLENIILKKKRPDDRHVHYSEHFEGDEYAYSENEVCLSDVSDHNIYAVCRLLLSSAAPWPMMDGGLLHSPPAEVWIRYKKLFALVEQCVYTPKRISRFRIAYELLRMLNTLVH